MLLIKMTALMDSDYTDVACIYPEGIAAGQATFQTEAYSWPDWNKGYLQHRRIIIRNKEVIAGWAALTSLSGRCVYAGVAEVGIYIGQEYRGGSIGDLLLKELIKISEANEIWTMQSGIFHEHEASIRLHEKNGFRIVGRREKIGKMNDAWRDTILMERRSSTIGT